jgi:hypothetical protein
MRYPLASCSLPSGHIGLVFAAVLLLGAAMTAAPAYATIPDTERQALLDLYASTHGEAWTHSDGWGGDTGTECSWYGVTCDGSQAHVTVSLGNNHLVGMLPPLDGLPLLERFFAFNNTLGGPLPALGGLTHLIVFNVAGNYLEGPIPSLANLSSLNYFLVGLNWLSGAPPEMPQPNNLLPGGSMLCPNALDFTPSADWDAATGITPWYRTCDPIFIDGFEGGGHVVGSLPHDPGDDQ